MESVTVIRASVIGDSMAIAELSGQLGYPASAVDIGERLARLIEHSENCVFTAVTDGQVIGWIHAFHAFRLESPAFVEIAGLVVDENSRGRHTGKELVSSVIRWAREQSVTHLRVRSNVKRDSAHAFYRHIGFEEVKDQKIFSLDI
jgi:GNAT superfamily N-acetyltransferase